MATSSDLEAARIARLPDTAYYIPDFLTLEEEVKLLQKARSFKPLVILSIY
jgi:hypothetical protein